MRRVLLTAASVLSMSVAGAAFAENYQAVPATDPQFMECRIYSMAKYEGGDALSPIAGQTKADAFCTCMWQETPEDFKGSLAKFSETAKGASTNKICEKYSNWGD